MSSLNRHNKFYWHYHRDLKPRLRNADSIYSCSFVQYRMVHPGILPWSMRTAAFLLCHLKLRTLEKTHDLTPIYLITSHKQIYLPFSGGEVPRRFLLAAAALLQLLLMVNACAWMATSHRKSQAHVHCWSANNGFDLIVDLTYSTALPTGSVGVVVCLLHCLNKDVPTVDEADEMLASDEINYY